MSRRVAVFRFYEELNDFLPPARRKREHRYAFRGAPSVKDAVEAQGVPHVEVDLILVDGESVGFDHPLRDGARVAVYPVFESLDVSPLLRLREHPLREPRFLCDVHLGALARRLRVLGFDTLYRDDADDPELADRAAGERRCLLTRDVGLLKRRNVERGYWLRSIDPDTQLREVVDRLDLRGAARPFGRCPRCNGAVEPVARAEVADRLEPGTLRDHDVFRRCADCGQVYWEGSHFERLSALVRETLEE